MRAAFAHHGVDAEFGPPEQLGALFDNYLYAADTVAFGREPDINADAASITRFRADRAAAHARRLTQMADATAKLQEVLTPDQRNSQFLSLGSEAVARLTPTLGDAGVTAYKQSGGGWINGLLRPPTPPPKVPPPPAEELALSDRLRVRCVVM